MPESAQLFISPSAPCSLPPPPPAPMLKGSVRLSAIVLKKLRHGFFHWKFPTIFQAAFLSKH